MSKIALFGTSADPPTAGHQSILNWLSYHYDLVVVWASDNPFKQHQASLKQRTEMLQLAIEEIKSPKHNISLHEELSDRRTLITLQKAKEIWGNNQEFTLVIGSDLVGQIKSWYCIQELLAQVEILIVPRPGYSIDSEYLQCLEKLGGKWAIASLNAPQVSSSIYRQEKNNKVITPAVQNYIYKQHLYPSTAVSHK